MILALIGAITGWLNTTLGMIWILPAALISVSLLVVAGYVLLARARPASLGITTEVAAIAVFLFGAMTTLGFREIAVILAIAMTAILAYKQPLHGMVGRISWDDMFAGVRLLIATFIVLPLLPNRTIDPLDALNPYSLWLLVLLISGLSLIGYVGTRVLGPGRGAAVTGLAGGLVSSTAITFSFARQSRERTGRTNALLLAGGTLLAWCVMFGRVVAEVLIVNRDLLSALFIPFLAMGIAAAIAATLCLRASTAGAAATPAPDVELKNPFSLIQASKFALLFAAVLFVVAFVQRYWADSGLYVVSALAGLTDVDAITLSMADYAKIGDARVAVNAIVIAALTNTVVKCGLAVSLGGPALRRPLMISTGAIISAGAVSLILLPLSN